MFRRVGTLSFSRLPFAEWEGFYHTVPYSAERGRFHRRFIKNGDLSRRLRATLPEGESFSAELEHFHSAEFPLPSGDTFAITF